MRERERHRERERDRDRDRDRDSDSDRGRGRDRERARSDEGTKPNQVERRRSRPPEGRLRAIGLQRQEAESSAPLAAGGACAGLGVTCTLRDSVHALSIQAKTPKQWESSPELASTPNCLGGSKA